MAANPVIEALLRQAQRGVSKINTQAGARGTALQPFAGQAASYYGQASGNEQALGSAVQGSLTQTGQQVGGQIGSALQGIQAPAQAVAQFGGGTATMGAQSGAAVGALSSADLQRLQSQGTAEQVYASALPRLAQLAGEQERRGFLEQMSQDLTDKIAEQEQQSHAEQLDQMWKQREWQRTMKQDKIERSRYRAKTRSDAQANRAAASRAAQALRLAQQKIAYETGQDYISNTQAQQRIGVSQGNLTERQRHAQETEAQARAREARQRAKDAKTGKGGGVVYKDIVASAKEIAKPTENPNTGQATRVPKADARRRLKAEFPGASAKQIEQALRAAGY